MKTDNPALYRKLSEPLADATVANEAIEAFFNDVYDLREKHHIRDVHVIVGGSIIGSSGDETEYAASAHLGDSLRAETMLGYTLGCVARDRQEAQSRLLSSKAITRQLNRR